MGETTLVIFSLCLQAAVGTMLFITLGKQLYKEKLFKGAALTAACLSTIGSLASLIHLNHPLLFLSTLSNLGNSWLSNEALLAGIFAGISIAYVLVQLFKPEHRILHAVLRWSGSAVGLIMVYSMAKVYTTVNVPVWSGINTFVDFYAAATAIGGSVFIITSLQELKNSDKKILGFIIMAAVIIKASTAIPHNVGLSVNGMAAQASAAILTEMSMVIWLNWLLILSGAATLLWQVLRTSDKTRANSPVNMVYVAGTCVVAGEVIGRYVFYAAMIATQIGLT